MNKKLNQSCRLPQCAMPHSQIHTHSRCQCCRINVRPIRHFQVKGMCMCVCECESCTCETSLSKEDVEFHANMLREGCKSVSLVTAHHLLLLLHSTTFSPSLNRCSPARLLPTHLSLVLSRSLSLSRPPSGVVSLRLGVLPPTGKGKGAARERGQNGH